ncbi:MAG: SAM-dependent methyltransferase [Gemmatimonadota bacterium]
MAGIEHVSDTARWVAVYRAMETERPDALFQDPWARQLAGEKGEQIVRSMRRGRAAAWAMIVRTQVFDELIRDAVHHRGVDRVVNLAAGLDARPWRLDLPAELCWVDVDLPDILDHKLAVIGDAPPRCDYRAVTADLADAGARSRVLAESAAGSRSALVVSEGLLIYLDPTDVGALAADLAGHAAYRWWLIDLASPRLLKMMQRSWGKATAAGQAPFRFAPEEGTDFFRPFGWVESEFRSSGEEARRLHRAPRYMAFWRAVFRFAPRHVRESAQRMAGTVLLERNAPPSMA